MGETKQKMIAAHRCGNCGKPLDREGYYCKACLAKANARRREIRAMRKELHLCPICGKQLYENETLCPDCEAKQYYYYTQRRSAQWKRDRDNKKHKECFHNRYYKLREQGICVRCGVNKTDGKHSLCVDCRRRKALQRKRHRLNELNRKSN